MSEQTLASRMNRAKSIDKFMTAVFYGVAIFFMALLVAFAGKVIIGGLMGASPEMFAFRREGSVGNQLFNTIYLVFIALVFSIPVGVFAGIYLAVYAKQGPVTRFLRVCIEALSSLPSIVVGLFGYLVFLVMFGMDKSLLVGALSVSILTLPLLTTTTEDAIKRFAGRLLPRQSRPWRDKMAVCFPRHPASLSATHHDRCHPGSWSWLR